MNAWPNFLHHQVFLKLNKSTLHAVVLIVKNVSIDLYYSLFLLLFDNCILEVSITCPNHMEWITNVMFQDQHVSSEQIMWNLNSEFEPFVLCRIFMPPVSLSVNIQYLSILCRKYYSVIERWAFGQGEIKYAPLSDLRRTDG